MPVGMRLICLKLTGSMTLMSASSEFRTKIGRGAVLHHDFPELFRANPDFTPIPLPVSEAHLRDERLGSKLIAYMRGWKGFVAD